MDVQTATELFALVTILLNVYFCHWIMGKCRLAQFYLVETTRERLEAQRILAEARALVAGATGIDGRSLIKRIVERQKLPGKDN